MHPRTIEQPTKAENGADDLSAALRRRLRGEPELAQAVGEVLRYVLPIVRRDPRYRDAAIVERLVTPDRVIEVRVVWVDDRGRTQVNHAWRVQFNNALGPYKGGMRFTSSLTPSVLKFLGFEQTLKNALTGLPLGGAKGGADFDPKGKSDAEVMRFCQSLMIELYPYLGPDLDIPAGDIGVGAREIGYLAGQYRRLTDRANGALTGKPIAFGGSAVRSEATGYGCVHFLEQMLSERGEALDGMRCLVSGAGNVALHVVERLIARGARVLTVSDTSGTAHAPGGITSAQLSAIEESKWQRREPLASIAGPLGLGFAAGQKPWSVVGDVALPCATQNELDERDAIALVTGGCHAVVEGANMPCTPEAVRRFASAGVLFAPGKAANAGGVAVSALEMSQNAVHLPWARDEVERKLFEIMSAIHRRCVHDGRGPDGRVDYVRGANVAAFRRVADAMVAQGIV